MRALAYVAVLSVAILAFTGCSQQEVKSLAPESSATDDSTAVVEPGHADAPAAMGADLVKEAGEPRVWLTSYIDAPEGHLRTFTLHFCPSGTGSVVWKISEPHAVTARDSAGSIIAIDRMSMPGMAQVGWLDADSCEYETMVDVGIASHDLAELILTADSGASVSFTAAELPPLEPAP